MVAAEDGGAAWQRLGGLEEDHGDVGAWVPWMEVNEQKPQHSSMCDVEVSQLCGFQIPLYFLIEKKNINIIGYPKIKWSEFPKIPKPLICTVEFEIRTTLAP